MSFADVTSSGAIPPIDFPVLVQATAPASPAVGTAWLDTSSGNQLKVWAVPGVWLLVKTPNGLPVPGSADMFLKSGTTAPYNPVWSDLAEGGTF